MADSSPRPSVPSPQLGRPAGNVTLTLEGTQFEDFIISLLGRQQSISRHFSGYFELTKSDIANLFQLIDQRAKQNAGVLVKFEATIAFSDNSSLTLHSYEELASFNDPRPVESRALHLSWDYLIRFPDKRDPEVQRVLVSFGRGAMDFDRPILLHFISPSSVVFAHSGFIAFRIEYTSRTWGGDIEALLTGFSEGLIRAAPAWQTFFTKISGWIVAAIAVIAVLSLLLSVVIASNHFASEQMSRVLAIEKDQREVGQARDGAIIDALVRLEAGGEWPRFNIKLTAIGIAAFVVGGALLIWFASLLDFESPGFVLLTRESEKAHTGYLAKRGKKWIWVGLAFLANLMNSVIANILFTRIA